MFDFVKDLIMHFSIILSLGFMYNFLYMQRRDIFHDEIFKGYICVALVLTMIFPVHFDGGLHFDLKLIPVFLTFFYLSVVDGILLIVLMLIINGFLDPSGWAVNVMNYTVLVAIFIPIVKIYQKSTLYKKVFLGFIIYSMITITRLVAMLHSGYWKDYPYLLVFSFISFFALASTIYIIEMTNFQIKTINELHKAEKFSAISQLAASVAHEIRNPMTTIRGFMQVLQGEKNLNENQNLFISISLQELDRTQTIIDNFLSLAKPNTNSNSNIDLTALLRNITEFMRSYSHLTNAELVEEIEENLMIQGDSHEIRQVFINIIKNGIEAMPNGGILSIRAESDQEFVKIQFTDEGIGMNQAQLNRLGNPYYSTKEKGTGLGMMISYDIVKRMRGKILVESMVGKGSTFIILLPLK